MKLYPPSSHALWCLSLLLVVAGTAHAQVPARARATTTPSTTTLQTRASSTVAPEPTITLAAPRLVRVGIGGQVVPMRLSGLHLAQVTSVQVVDTSGVPQPHIRAHLSSRAGSNSSLSLQVFAGKDAVPGQYRLQLLLPADLGRVQNRPQSAPLGGASRSVLVPQSKASITVHTMEPAITSVAPAQPARGTALHPRVIVSGVPGSEIISVARFEDPVTQYCYYRPDSRATPTAGHRGGVNDSRWSAPNTVQLDFMLGEFDKASKSPCQLRFSIRTKNALGEEFTTFTPPFLLNLRAAPTPTRLPVSSTWALKNYLHLPLGFHVGMCAGNSLGAHGSIPVGIVNVNGKLGFRARSGPIGTECSWQVATNRLEPGWTLHMTFRIHRIGNQCNVTDGSTPQFKFTATRHAQILKNGEVSLGSNLSNNGNALKLIDLRCGATLSNDHEVLLEMTSASVSRVNPLPRCDWKCAFR